MKNDHSLVSSEHNYACRDAPSSKRRKINYQVWWLIIIWPIYDIHSHVYFRVAEVASAFVEETGMAH